MRGRLCGALVVGLGLLTGCGDGGTGPGLDGKAQGAGQPGVLQGSVVTIRFQPDSEIVLVAGVEVQVYYVDSLPSDTTTPPDSSGMTPLMGFNGMLDSFPLPPDTLPNDSTPPPPPPVDTIPTDTTPPPPPLPGCGRGGDLVATVTTNAQGKFTVPNLAQGKYDLIAVAPDGYTFDGLYCGVHLLGGRTADITVFLPPAPDPLPGLRRR